MNREYCLSNHIQGKDLGDIPIDPKARKQSHGQLDHFFSFEDDDRLLFEAPKPVPLPTMMPLNAICSRFAHHELFGGDDGRIALPLIRTVVIPDYSYPLEYLTFVLILCTLTSDDFALVPASSHEGAFPCHPSSLP